MANVLKCYFKDASNKDLTMNYNYAKASPNGAAVRSLMEGMIANAAIYSNPPAAISGAEIVVTTTTPITL